MNEEFERLIKLIKQAGDQVTPNVNELLLKTLSFFNSLKAQFKEANEEERKEIVAMMKQMHAQLAEEVSKMAKRTGLNEDELSGIMDNPQYFTPEQQQILAKTKAEIEEAKNVIRRKNKPESEEVKSKVKKTKKDKWMKS